MPVTEPDGSQPTLQWWSHVWRLLLMLAVSATVWVPTVEQQARDMPVLWWTDLVLGVACYVLVWRRRRWPMSVAIVTALCATFSGVAAGPAVLALVSLATRRVWWQVISAGLLSLLSAQLYTVVVPQPDEVSWYLTFSLNVGVTAALCAWGMFIGSRRELLWTLRQRAENAEAEQERRVEQARATERARIAREMHDVLAHRISQISMHAGALTFREDLDGDQVRDSVQVIQTKAQEALNDLRGVLGVLRGDDVVPTNAPQPTYADLGTLIEEARATGTSVSLTDQVASTADTPVPESTGRTLYRIVQEGLTNARKHAPGAAVEVTLSGSASDGVRFRLVNGLGFGPSALTGSGLGLVGLTERAELAGGRLQQHREGTSFVLSGWIPWAT